jgi:hypothetical protein
LIEKDMTMRVCHAVTRPLLGALTLAAGLMLSLGAQAHDDAYLDSIPAPHGGQVRMAGALHLELVLDNKAATANKPITVYVTDHAGQPQSTAGATGSITVLSGKTKVSTTLQADGQNRLKGQAAYASSPDTKAVLTVTLAGQDAQQARFTPFAKPVAHTDDEHEHSAHQH